MLTFHVEAENIDQLIEEVQVGLKRLCPILRKNEPLTSDTQTVAPENIPFVSHSQVIHPSPVQQTSNEEVDASGATWNPNLHSSSKMKTSAGLWKKKKGFKEAVLEKTVESNVTYIKPTSEPVTVQPFQKQVESTVSQAVNSFAVEKEALQPKTHKYSLETFRHRLIAILGALIDEGKITREYIVQLQDFFQVKGVWEIAEDEQKVSGLYQTFVSSGLIQAEQ